MSTTITSEPRAFRREISVVANSQILVVVLALLLFGLANLKDNAYITSAATDTLFALSVLLTALLLSSPTRKYTTIVQVICTILVFIMVGVASAVPDSHQILSYVVPLVFIVAVAGDVLFWPSHTAKVVGSILLVTVLSLVVCSSTIEECFLQRTGAVAVGFLFWIVLFCELIFVLTSRRGCLVDPSV